MTTIERIAGWAAELAVADVPSEVLAAARAQRQSVVGGVAASAGDRAARRIAGAVAAWAADGPAPLVGTDRSVAVEAALYGATAWSMALDFDDYVCFGHTGHSAVLVPMLLATETGATGDEQLAAQVVANEVGARLGGACLLGPLNGQLWSFVHAAGAALAAGRLLGLDRARLAHALALSLYQAPRPTVPGFMAPDSKLLTAGDPAVAGLRAARLAAAGVTGPLDVLDHPQGFLGAFSYVPLPRLLGGLGRGWATRTLSVKRYPGCAYIDTTVDALLQLELPDPADIAEVVVEASLLTTEMDALSAAYATGAPSPVTVTFSIPWNVAIVVVAGQLTPRELTSDWLASNGAALDAVRRRVTVRHSWALTRDTARAFAGVLPVRAALAGVPVRQLLVGGRRLRADRAGLHLRAADLVDVAGLIGDGVRRPERRGAGVWSDEALAGFAMTFPARVVVRHRDGTVLEAAVAVPAGGAGNPVVTPADVAEEKLRRWGPALLGEGTGATLDAIAGDADRPLATLTASTVDRR